MPATDMIEKRFAVTGNPILHSKSPIMFNAVFTKFSYPAVYTRLAASSAEEALFLFNELRLDGMNVTAPFKKDMLDYMDFVDRAGNTINAINTVVRRNGGLYGYNTDYLGVVEALTARGIDVKEKICVVIGAGGAGRAAIYGLINAGARVTLINRTFEKALHVARVHSCNAEPIERLEEILRYTHILVSTLPHGIDVIKPEWLRKDQVVFDASYKSSTLIRNAFVRGCTVIKGEEWLLNQAIPAFGLFMGNYPSPEEIDVMKNALASSQAIKPSNIALTGFMGSGKSVVGQALAQAIRCGFKDIDQSIEVAECTSIPEIFKTRGEVYFRMIEKRVLKQELETQNECVVSCGGGAVMDEENRSLLKNHSLIVWLYASISTTLKRLEPGSRPLLDCPEPEEKAGELLKQRLPFYTQIADIVVNSESGIKETVEKIHGEICKAFGN